MKKTYLAIGFALMASIFVGAGTAAYYHPKPDVEASCCVEPPPCPNRPDCPGFEPGSGNGQPN